MMNQVEIYFHDLTPVAQQRVLPAARMSDASDGNFENSPLAILDYEVEGGEYVPEVGHIVNVAEPPDSNSAWSHGFIGTVKAINVFEGYATITDMDENAFDIDFIYLTKDESEE